jgi:hypothetical protein
MNRDKLPADSGIFRQLGNHCCTQIAADAKYSQNSAHMDEDAWVKEFFDYFFRDP